MSGISFPLTSAQQNASQIPAPQTVPAVPQPNTAQQDGSPQQDSVTLVGRSAENQQVNQDASYAQFRDGTNFYFAERQSFRAANGSQQTPKLPIQIKDEAVLRGSGRDQASESTAVAQATNLTQQPQAGQTTANGASTTAQADTAQSAAPSVASSTPQQQLAQLDQTLQEIGVNPQSIALFNRMAMLLYANDPAALKELVQQLQSTTPSTSANDAGSSNAPSSPGTNAAQELAAQPSNQAGYSGNSQSPAGASNVGAAVATAVTLADAQANQAVAPSSAQSSSSASQDSFSVKLEELQLTFTAISAESQGAAAASPSPQLGQALDVSA